MSGLGRKRTLGNPSYLERMWKPERTVMILLAAILFPMLLLSRGCASLSAPPSYRYKMTAHVETGETIRTFSTVREVTFRSDYGFPSFEPQHVRFESGEAIPIDIPGRPTYFVTIERFSPLGPEEIAIRRAIVARNGGNHPKNGFGQVADRTGVYELPREASADDLSGLPHSDERPQPRWPTILSLWDPSDPTTARTVDPASIGLRRITVEITDEPVERRVERYIQKDEDGWYEARRSFHPDQPESLLRARYQVAWAKLSVGD